MTSKQKKCRPARDGKSGIFTEIFCGSFVERIDLWVNAASQIVGDSGDERDDI